MNIERWSKLMDAWGFKQNAETFESLQAAYAERGRHYHTHEHIDACLQHFDQFEAQMEQPLEVELAIWFHDAIYRPFSAHNEQHSAEWASSFLADNAASSECIDRVHRLIMVTEHLAPTQTTDEALLVDIDLAILGSRPEIYADFEDAVRKEYRLVPTFVYRKKRVQILEGFLARSQIYHHEPFKTAREKLARENLASAIAKLSGHV